MAERTLQRRRLRRRILAWSFVPAAVILFAVAVVAVFAYSRVTEQQAIQKDQELARLTAASLATEINQFSLDLESLTRQSAVASGLPERQQQALAAASNKLAVFDAGTVILDAHGTFAAAWPERPADSGADWSSRAYFVQMLSSSRPAYSNVVNDGIGGAQVIVVAVPIIGPQGEFNGVLAGMFEVGAKSVSALYGSIAKLRVGVSGGVYVVDGNGRVIQHPDATLVGADLMSERVVRNAVAGQVGAERTRDPSGQDVVAGYAPVPGTGWGLVAVETWSMLIEPFQGYRTFLLVLLILGLLVPSLVVLLGVRRLTRPVSALTEAARRVADGDFEHPVTIRTHDELQELAEQFNEMSTRLRDSYAELDERIATRTRELATLNAVSAVVIQSLDLEQILDDALGKIMTELGFEAGAAFMLHEEDGERRLELVASRALTKEVLVALGARPPDALMARLEELNGQPIALPAEELALGEGRSSLTTAGWGSVVQLPVAAKGAVFGDLLLFTQESLSLPAGQLGSLAALGHQIGMAVDNARLYERAEESAAATERNRLARDLHDAVSQTLFSASLLAEVLPRIYERDPRQGAQRLNELRQLTRGALAEMRTLLLELRPAALTEADLPDLLEQLGDAVSGRSHLPVAVRVDTALTLPPEVRVAIFRIAQEALNNVAKHSQAERAAVTLLDCREHGRDVLELTIEDDGIGFDPGDAPSGRLGIGIMAERAEAVGARLRVDASPGEGTRIRVVWDASRFRPGADGEAGPDVPQDRLGTS